MAPLGALVILAQSRTSAAEEGRDLTETLSGAKRQWTASLRWENDMVAGTDRY